MANLKFGFNFNGAWTARLDQMFAAKLNGARDNPLITEFLEGIEGVNSVDDLSNRQKARLWLSYQMMRELIKVEGQQAREQAHLQKVNEIKGNFPLEVGDE